MTIRIRGKHEQREDGKWYATLMLTCEERTDLETLQKLVGPEDTREALRAACERTVRDVTAMIQENAVGSGQTAHIVDFNKPIGTA